MIISLDYDDTYTRDPILWMFFMETALERGHEVWCVSARMDRYMDEVRETVGYVLGADKCVGTNGEAKADFMWQHYGLLVDVWIDDNPEWVNHGVEKTLFPDYYDLDIMDLVEFKSVRV